MSKTLSYEIRQENEVNRLDFRCNNTISVEEKEEIRISRYLQEIEDLRDRSEETLLKKKLISTLSSEKAYRAIQALRSVEISDGRAYVKFSIKQDLTEPERARIRESVQSIYGSYDIYTGSGISIEEVELKEPDEWKDRGDRKRVRSQFKENEGTEKIEKTKEAQSGAIDNIQEDPIWTKVKESLAKRYSEGVVKSWFSKLEYKKSEDGCNNITLVTKSAFIKSRIESEYLDSMKDIFRHYQSDITDITITV